MIGRPARRRRIDAFKSKFAKIQFINKDIDYSNRVGVGDVVVQALR